MLLKIVSLEFARGRMSPGELIDIANWHAEKATVAKREGNHNAAQRHTDIEDLLVVRARQMRAAQSPRRAA